MREQTSSSHRSSLSISKSSGHDLDYIEAVTTCSFIAVSVPFQDSRIFLSIELLLFLVGMVRPIYHPQEVSYYHCFSSCIIV